MKRGLIFPRRSMQNVWTGQDLPAVYGEIAPYLVELHEFSEATGLYAYDKSGSGQVGTLAGGASWANGLPGSIDCDGTNDYINIGKNVQAYVDYNKASTLECWVNFDAFTSTSQYSLFDVETLYVSGKYGIISFRLNNNYIEYIYYSAYSSNNARIYIREGSITSAISAGNWYHLVATNTGAGNAGGLNIYINGGIRSTSVVYNESITQSIWNATGGLADLDLYIMARNYDDTSGFHINGRMAKAAIYSTNLSVDQILKIYNYEKRYLA